MSKKYLQVVSFKNNRVVKELCVSGKSERQIDKIENGINRNLNHEEYFTRESNISQIQ